MNFAHATVCAFLSETPKQWKAMICHLPLSCRGAYTTSLTCPLSTPQLVGFLQRNRSNKGWGGVAWGEGFMVKKGSCIPDTSKSKLCSVVSGQRAREELMLQTES